MPEIRVHRVTKYDPADRNEYGHYTGPLDSACDEGPIEAAYLEALTAFAAEAGVERLEIRDPEAGGIANFHLGPMRDDHGLSGLFPELTGFHDGAEVDVATAVELVRVMLRGSGGWCRLEVEDRFFVHVGYDQYMYIGTAGPYEGALRRTRKLGLFPEELDGSPYEPAPDGSAPEPPADERFWERLRRAVEAEEVQLLEEGFVANTSRWHRLTPDTLDAVRAGLVPRSRLVAWPDRLRGELDAVIGELGPDGGHRVLREHADGRLTSCWIYPDDPEDTAAELAGTRRAAALPEDPDPAVTAVLPDPDGVVRVRGLT